MDPHGEPQDLELARTSASYWLDVCQGREAAEAFIDAARRMVASPSGRISEPSPFAVINEYCALMLPQMPDAIKELAGEARHPIMAALCETSGETLDMIQRD